MRRNEWCSTSDLGGDIEYMGNVNGGENPGQRGGVGVKAGQASRTF